MYRLAIAALVLITASGCTTTRDWSATGGSRADGVVRLAYEQGEFETVQVSETQAIDLASRRCASWGYNGAEAFGGITRDCTQMGGFGGCSRYRITKEFQCTGEGNSASSQTQPPAGAKKASNENSALKMQWSPRSF
jgi:hypothetical protein